MGLSERLLKANPELQEQEVVTEGKKKPVQKTETDAPVQVNASNTASSGDSSAIVEGVDNYLNELGDNRETQVQRNIERQSEEEKPKVPLTKEKLAKKDKDFSTNLKPKIEARQKELFDSSPAMKRFSENFNKFSKADLEIKAKELIKKYPKASTDPGQEKSFYDELNNYRNTLWQEHISNSSTLIEEDKRISDIIDEEFQVDIDAYQVERKELLSDEYDRTSFFGNVFPEGSFADDLFTTIGIGGQRLINDLRGSAKSDQTLQVVSQAETTQKFLDSQLEKGFLTQEQYDERSAGVQSILEKQKIDRLKVIEDVGFQDEIERSVNKAVTDTDDKDFHSLSNYTLVVAEQLANTLPALAARSIGGNVTKAYAISAYAAQLYNEYEDKGLRAHLADELGIPPHEVSNEQLNEFAFTPRGRDIISEARVASVPAGALTYVTDSFQLGGAKALKPLTAAAAKISNKLRLTRLTTGRFNPIRLAGIPARGAASEIPEELTQQFIGDVVASRAVRKDLNIFQSISDAYTNINPKEYKDIAIISAIAGGGLSSASATPGEIIGAAKEYRSASNLKKLANLSEEDFQRYTANAKGRLSEVLNDTTADKQAKAEAYTSYVTLLDHEQGHNELKQFPAIKGKYKGKALQILAERAALDRDVKSSPGTGLAANAKERIKAIDEQLQSIEGRARRGYKSTALEKIRSLVGPRRSVGAQRAANLPQKLVDKVEEVLQFTSDLGEAARRLSPLKSEFNLTDENFDNIISTLGKEFQQSGSVGLFEYLESKQKQEEQSREGFEPTKETKAVNQLPKNITPEGTDTIAQAQQEKIEDFYHNEGLAVPANVAKRFETPYSEPINVVAEGQQNPYLGDAGSLDEAVSRVVNFSANKGDILRQALQQASRSEKIGNRSNAAQGIRNEGWIPNRIKKQIKTAESLRKDLLKNHSQNGAEIIAALDEFIDLKYAVDGLVRQYVNESLESKDVGQKRGRVRQGIAEWDRAIDDTLNIADAVSRGGIDTQTKKAFQTELSDRLAYLEKLYAYGLVQVEKQIALQGAKEGQYPPMFNPATGRFEFNFNNKFGNSVIYDLFPSNGEVTFENLPLKDWAYTVVKYNIAQTKTGDAYTKFMARARDHAQKVFAKGSSKNLKDIQEVDAKEQRAITAALKILETGDVVRKDTLPTLVKDTDIATTDQKEEEAVQKAFDSLRAEIDTVAIGSEGEFDYNLAQAYIDTKLLEGGSDVQVKALNRIIKGQSAEAGSLNTQNIQDLKGDRSKYATKSTDKLKEVHKDRPIIRWEAMAKDPRISLEGDILHMIYVQGASQILTEDQADFLNDSQIIDFFNTPTSPLANIDAQNDISSKLQAIESVRGWDYIDDMYSEHIKLTEQLHSLQRGDSELALEGVGQENLLGEKLQRAISDYIELVGKTEAIAFLRGSAGLQYKTDLVTKAQNGNEVAMQALIDSYSDFLKLTIQEYVPEWHNEDNNKFGFTRNPATGALESVRSGDDVWQTWDSVSLAGPSIGDFEGTARNATRKAIFYYDATKGKLGTYIQNVVRGAIVAQLNGETISWNPVRKQIKAQQARAKLELTQQIYYDSIIGDGDITLIGEEGIGPKVLTEDQIKFLHELPNSKAKRDIAVTKQRIADTKKVIEISEGNTKIRLENKLHLLNARLGEQQSNEVVSESLPAIADNFQNSAGWTEGSKELNIVNVANLVAQGNAVDVKIDLIDLPGELTLDQYKQHLLLLEGSNRTLEQLQEKVANFSADIKSMGLARDINEGISATQLQNIEEAR
ncbi:MAG: hypothetical protein K0U41_07015, partial [Gammaproteobacteria bacterium]|nr:hypothetical protein [Gammaproteobacteria bacterium]